MTEESSKGPIDLNDPVVEAVWEVAREMGILAFAVLMFVLLMIAMMPITAAIWPFY